ncbi:hypothetical protein [Nocardioides sp.]|uniref:hypothetical protein n=1 Tax=Nocardioides sp. TaxID=35761 RepID=UPI00321C3057
MGMHRTASVLLRLALVAPPPAPGRSRDDRGDVPGWVLVTLMSVGLMVAIGAVAQDQLTEMLRSALNSVK